MPANLTDGSAWRGKNAVVIGTGNSGHDVAQDLHSHGVNTTIVQRGSTTVVSIDPSAKLNYALYDEGLPLDDTDLINTATAYPLVIRGYQLAVQKMIEWDKPLIDGLKARGFKYDIGHDNTGHQMKYQRPGRWLLSRCWLFKAHHRRRHCVVTKRPHRPVRSARYPVGRWHSGAYGSCGSRHRLSYATRARTTCPR